MYVFLCYKKIYTFIICDKYMLRRPRRISASVVGAIEKLSNKQFLLGYDASKQEHLLNRGIYVLELQGGKIYVGKSNNITARIQEHKDGRGCEFACHVVQRLVPHIEYTDDFESWERAETLFWMSVKGVDKVRGWLYTMTHLTKEQRKHAFEQICERYDLCRRCGKAGHFISECTEKGKMKKRGVIITSAPQV